MLHKYIRLLTVPSGQKFALKRVMRILGEEGINARVEATQGAKTGALLRTVKVERRQLDKAKAVLFKQT